MESRSEGCCLPTVLRLYPSLKSVNLFGWLLISGCLLGNLTRGHDMRITELKVTVVILPSCFGGKSVSVPFCGILEKWDA
jgi:hypothetical protein